MYMNFSEALEELRSGEKVARKIWNGRGIFIQIRNPVKGDRMTGPYLFIVTPREVVPWVANQIELFAEDWVIVE